MRYNYRWSLADLDRIKALAPSHTLEELAAIMQATTPEIAAVCRRNGILTKPARNLQQQEDHSDAS